MLNFCLAPVARTVRVTGMAVAPGAEITVIASDLGSTGDTFFNVTNTNAAAGSFEIILVG